MTVESEMTDSHQEGDPAGRFCPTCRGPMLYTGQQRDSELGLNEQERCSTCGFTAWKRLVLRSDERVRDQS